MWLSLQFSFHSCNFKVQKCKEGTGRVVMWRMGILNSYTMESTFGGSTLGELTSVDPTVYMARGATQSTWGDEILKHVEERADLEAFLVCTLYQI